MPPEALPDDRPPAASLCADGASGARRLVVLDKRADFLACARGRKAPAPAFLLQARRRITAEPAGPKPKKPPEKLPETPVRVGFTASKKIGNAVARNRAKRRLRALARAVLAREARPGWDYVLVARRDATATCPFAEMKRDLSRALERVHSPKP
ncbi:MAG: ribonuclease P protein component [Rhodobacterales bacterium]|nr:MAG: ribonuclease P protein component [Rhodobacterales bacterium]